jgi:hypothetical protein
MRNLTDRLMMTKILALCLVGATLASAETLTLDVWQNRFLGAPHVAFNTMDRLYLAAWEYHYAASDWDINGRMVDTDGQPVGDAFGIAWGGTIKQQETDVCYNPVTNQFLVAYSLSPGNWNVSACVVDGNGTPGPFVHIADTTFTELSPAVACDPTTGHYLTIYEREHVLDSTVWREVWAQDLLADGTRLNDPYRLSDPAAHSYQCAVACAGGQYLVVWREESGSKGVILGRIIQWGYPSKTTLKLAQTKDSCSPQVAYNPARAEYLVVYQDRTSPSARWAIEGTRVSTLGEVKGTNTITKGTNEHCQAPDVACDLADGQYVVTWAQGPAIENPSLASHQIWAQRVDGDGKPIGGREPVSSPGKTQPAYPGVPSPAVASGFCGKALIVWEDHTVGAVPSATIYSILGSHGAWGSLCAVPDCNGLW